MRTVVELRNVWKIYGEKTGFKFIALRDISLKIYEGELVVIMGPSGSGKTTLLNLIGTLDKPSKGRVFIDGVDVTDMPEDKLALFRSLKIGFVFQQFNLISNFTALENVMLPMLLSGKYDVKEAKYRALELLRLVGLEKHAHKRPIQLSGGQQQRVAIARALANDPSIILMDEPTGSVDVISAAKILSLVKWLNEKYGQTILIVTHDPEVAGIASRLIYIRGGRLYENPPKEVILKHVREELSRKIYEEDVHLSQLKLLKHRLETLRKRIRSGAISKEEYRRELEDIKERMRRLGILK